jgi:hypothetical protein
MIIHKNMQWKKLKKKFADVPATEESSGNNEVLNRSEKSLRKCKDKL